MRTRNKSAPRRAPGISSVICLCLVVCGILPAGAPAQAQNAASSDPRWAILVAGISGDPALQKEYLKELTDLRALLEGQLGFPRDHVVVLFDDPKLDPVHIQYASNRENLEKVCRDIAGRAGKEDMVFVFLEGHGDSDGNGYKFNLVGPDLTAEELAMMFYSNSGV